MRRITHAGLARREHLVGRRSGIGSEAQLGGDVGRETQLRRKGLTGDAAFATRARRCRATRPWRGAGAAGCPPAITRRRPARAVSLRAGPGSDPASRPTGSRSHPRRPELRGRHGDPLQCSHEVAAVELAVDVRADVDIVGDETIEVARDAQHIGPGVNGLHPAEVTVADLQPGEIGSRPASPRQSQTHLGGEQLPTAKLPVLALEGRRRFNPVLQEIPHSPARRRPSHRLIVPTSLPRPRPGSPK